MEHWGCYTLHVSAVIPLVDAKVTSFPTRPPGSRAPVRSLERRSQRHFITFRHVLLTVLVAISLTWLHLIVVISYWRAS